MKKTPEFLSYNHPIVQLANQAILDITGGVPIEQILPDSAFIELGRPTMLYSISVELKEIIESLSSSFRPENAGLCLGTRRKTRFDLSLESLPIINYYTRRFIVVDKKGEQEFLYGHNLEKKRIIKEFNVIKHSRCIVRNVNGEAIGIGILENSSESSQLRNIQDLGYYLRKENMGLRKMKD